MYIHAAHASAYNIDYQLWTYALIEFMAWMVDGWFCDTIPSIRGISYDGYKVDAVLLTFKRIPMWHIHCTI